MRWCRCLWRTFGYGYIVEREEGVKERAKIVRVKVTVKGKAMVKVKVRVKAMAQVQVRAKVKVRARRGTGAWHIQSDDALEGEQHEYGVVVEVCVRRSCGLKKYARVCEGNL